MPKFIVVFSLLRRVERVESVEKEIIHNNQYPYYMYNDLTMPEAKLSSD